MTSQAPWPTIALIGYRGTGKTTVAQCLATRLQRPWHDTDIELECRAGCSIEDIFADQGEGHFRDLEQATVAELTGLKEAVLALGGGAVLRDANRQALRGTWKVWLVADAQTIAARLAADPLTAKRRPALTDSGGLTEIERLLKARTPIYRDCADFAVDTADKSAEQVADEIVSLLQKHGQS